jgi:hypothetical protein
VKNMPSAHSIDQKNRHHRGNVQILGSCSMRRLKRLLLVFYLLHLTARDGGNAGLALSTDRPSSRM